MKLLKLNIFVMIAIALLIIWAVRTFGQERRQIPVPQNNWQYVDINDFSGGLNLIDHPTAINDNELLSAQNVIYQGKNLIGRAGYQILDNTFNVSRNIKGITKVYKRDGTAIVYIALGESLYFSNAPENNWTALTGGTIDSTEYVEFLAWNDTTYFVDGSKFGKIVGTTIADANTCDSGRISGITTTSMAQDIVEFLISSNKFDLNAISKSTFYPIKDPNNLNIGKGFLNSDSARALLWVDLLSELQAGDSIISATCSLYVNTEYLSDNETLGVKRDSTDFNIKPILWANKPIMTGIEIDTAIISAKGAWIDLNLRSWVNSIVNDSSGVKFINKGLQLYLKDETNLGSSKNFRVGMVPVDGKEARFKVARIPKVQIISPKPDFIVDTNKAGIWEIDNEWVGYFVEFPQLDDTNRFRLITANKWDTLFFTPRLITSDLIGKSYRIVSRPSSIEKVYPTGANPNTIDTVTTHSFADSLRYVYIGNQPDLAGGTLNGNTYFLKIISGKGIGDYQILKNYSGAGDFLLIFSGTLNFLDSTSRFEIYRRVFPSPEHFTVNKSRFWFADTLHFGRLWFSEPNRPAQVGAFNFHTVGGDPSEGEITYLGGLYVSNYAEPQNPLVIGRENSIYLEFDDNPRLDFPRKILHGIGISSARSVIPIAGGLFHNHRSKYYLFDGQKANWVSQKLGIPFKDNLAIYASSFLLNNIIYTNVPNKDTSYTFHLESGVWTGKHDLGWTVATSQQGARDSTPIYLSKFQGAEVRNFGRTADDNANAVVGIFQTKYFNLGHPEITKVLREFTIDYSTQVPTWIGMSAGFGTSAKLDIVFYGKDNALSGASTDSIHIQTSANGDWSTKKHLTGASIGKNFSFKIKSDNVSGYRVGRVTLGFEQYSNIGAGGN